MQELTQQEFYQLMLNDLQQDYFMGLHQISIRQHNDIAKNEVSFNIPALNIDNPTYKDIVDNIFKYGLNVPYGSASRTVKSFGTLKNLMEGFFDYYFYIDDYYIIIAIPTLIEIDNRKYFVGNLEERNVLTACLLKYYVPTEYIYGYYEKKDDTYIFEKNSNHISTLTYPEQLKFYAKLLKESKIPLQYLEMIKKEQTKFFNVSDNKNIAECGPFFDDAGVIKASILEQNDYINSGILRAPIRIYKRYRTFYTK